MSVLVLGEKPSANLIYGGILIAIGVLITLG
jgi:drug/metabolite transporter (DMT)-like permease